VSVLIQHGWGYRKEIREALAKQTAAGAILSPRDEGSKTMGDLARDLKAASPSSLLLFDPQFHALGITNARLGSLPGYPYYRSQLGRSSFTGSAAIAGLVHPVLDYQMGLEVDRLVSPTVLLEELGDTRAQVVSLFLAHESIDYHAKKGDPRPLLISVVLSEAALSQETALHDFLDELSLLDAAAGFYVVIRRTSAGYSQRFGSKRLAALMYLVYVLGETNRFEVILGYTDLVGSLLRAVGARAWASGSSQNLRRFTKERFEPISGGKPARRRYTSLPLLNSLLVSELDSCHQAGVLPEALSGGPLDDIILSARNPSAADGWSREVSASHHWWVLSQLDAVVSSGDWRARLAACQGALSRAKTLYGVLTERKVALAPASGPKHLDEWDEAVTGFMKLVEAS